MQKIMYNSPLAAQYKKNIEGWFCRHGYFYDKDQHLARIHGCTHIECRICNKEIPKSGWSVCNDCIEKKEIEKYERMEAREWDEKSPVYSDSEERYFHTQQQIKEYCEDEGCTKESLRLRICDSEPLPKLDQDYFLNQDEFLVEYDHLGELPEELIEAIDNVNKVIDNMDPISWYPSNYKVKLEKEKK